MKKRTRYDKEYRERIYRYYKKTGNYSKTAEFFSLHRNTVATIVSDVENGVLIRPIEMKKRLTTKEKRKIFECYNETKSFNSVSLKLGYSCYLVEKYIKSLSKKMPDDKTDFLKIDKVNDDVFKDYLKSQGWKFSH